MGSAGCRAASTFVEGFPHFIKDHHDADVIGIHARDESWWLPATVENAWLAGVFDGSGVILVFGNILERVQRGSCSYAPWEVIV
jgi:hypothetical protein